MLKLIGLSQHDGQANETRSVDDAEQLAGKPSKALALVPCADSLS
jgi:hypothetical protein